MPILRELKPPGQGQGIKGGNGFKIELMQRAIVRAVEIAGARA